MQQSHPQQQQQQSIGIQERKKKKEKMLVGTFTNQPDIRSPTLP